MNDIFSQFEEKIDELLLFASDEDYMAKRRELRRKIRQENQKETVRPKNLAALLAIASGGGLALGGDKLRTRGAGLGVAGAGALLAGAGRKSKEAANRNLDRQLQLNNLRERARKQKRHD